MRFGLLGTGHWAAQTQAEALSAHPEAQLVGVWGRDAAKAEAVAARFGARGYPELDQLLSEVDAVAVAVPPDVPAQPAVRAASARRPTWPSGRPPPAGISCSTNRWPSPWRRPTGSWPRSRRPRWRRSCSSPAGF